jgi:hypothetical protein
MEAINFLYGALGGLVHSLIGFFKNGKPFDLGKFFLALVYGAVGGAALAYGFNLTGWTAFFAGVFADVALKPLGDIIFTKIGIQLPGGE